MIDRRYILILLFIFGLFYIKLIKVDIIHNSSSNGNIKFTITSSINQSADFHIKSIYKKSRLECNGNIIYIDNSKKHDYFYHGEELITIPLKIGDNRCSGEYISKDIQRKFTLIEATVIFILIVVPLFNLIFYIFISLLNRVDISQTGDSSKVSEIKGSKWIIGIIIVGFAVRLLYFNKYGVMLFQHDWQGHIDLIKYMAQNYAIPDIPNKGWEYPQQPLYYIITASIYSTMSHFHFTHNEILYYGVGYFSLLCSLIFLIYGYGVMQLLTSNRWVQGVSMLFISFTPSIVYMSARVNNDVLVMGLVVVTLFYAIRAYEHNFKRYFYMALISVTLLFLTKISTASIELFLFTLLILVYIRDKSIKRELYLYSLIGVLLLYFTLWHLYTPLNEHLFYMVNSAKFPKQTIEHLNSSYFFSFNILDLISQGYSYVFGNDSVRYSLPTYQYGTALFGEFDYEYFIKRADYLLFVMRSIIILGSIYIIALISYILHLSREKIVAKTLFGVLIINLILILKFIISYPSICNSDFRYFVSSFIVFGYAISKGLYYIGEYNRYIKYSINTLLVALVTMELMLFFYLIKD